VRVRADARPSECGAGQVDVPALRAGEQRVVVIELPAGNDLTMCVRVVDGETDRPIANATAEIAAEAGVAGALSVDESRSTDADGRVQLHVPSWRPIRVRFDAAGYGAATTSAEPGHDRVDLALIVPLLRSATLRVKVARAEAGKVEPVWARLYPKPQATEPFYFAGRDANVPACDAEFTAPFVDGSRAEIRGIPARTVLRGEWRSSGGAVSEQFESLTFAPGEVREVDWTARRRMESSAKTWIDGVVLDANGAGVAHKELDLVRHADDERESELVEVRTDGKGHFLSKLGPGSWRVEERTRETLRFRRDQLVARPELFEVANGTERQSVVVHLELCRFIRGRVLEPDGTPCESVSVGATSTTSRWSTGMMGMLDGRFGLGPLASGEYELVVRSMSSDAATARLRVEAGNEDLIVQLSASARIEGRVLDELGRPVAGCEVLRSGFDGESGDTATRTDADGRFVLARLAAGTHAIVACAVAGRFAIAENVSLAAGGVARDVGLIVRSGGTLNVSCAARQSDAHCFVRLQPTDVVLAHFGIANVPVRVAVPPGHVVVRLMTTELDKPLDRIVTVIAGETIDVEF
jgi:hypothetical protein